MNTLLQWFQPRADSLYDDDRQFIRERILTVILIIAALLGAVAYWVNVLAVTDERSWGWVVVYTLAFGWVCAMALFRQIRYEVRVGSLLVTLYLLGITSALQYGAAGDARIWFMGAVILATVFVGMRGGLTAMLVTITSYLMIGWMFNRGQLGLPDTGTLTQIDNFDSWLTTGTAYFGVGGLIVASLGVLVNGLNNSVKRGRELADALQFDREQLEERTRSLERREVQIRTAAEISRVAAAELNPSALFQRVADLVQSRFNLYYVGVFTTDEAGHFALLQAGTGEAGKKMLAKKHKLPIGSTSMIGYAISRGEARVASDVGLEAHFFDNPDLPETRSELALPMISGKRVLGAITVQSTLPNVFDQEDIAILQGIADSLAIALKNARLFEQVQANLREIQALHNQYILESWETVGERQRTLRYTYQPDPSQSDELTAMTPANGQEIALKLRDQVIGSLTVETQRGTLTPKEQAFIEAVSQQTVLALENVRLVEETQRAAKQEQIVSAISEQFSSVLDVESALKVAAQSLGRLPNVTEVSVYIEPTHPKNKNV